MPKLSLVQSDCWYCCIGSNFQDFRVKSCDTWSLSQVMCESCNTGFKFPGVGCAKSRRLNNFHALEGKKEKTGDDDGT